VKKVDDVPESVREDIDMLTDETILSDAEAETYGLFMSDYTYAQISDIRDVKENTVENALRNARDRIEKAYETAQKLPVKKKHLGTTGDYLDVTSLDYLGLDWTDWEDCTQLDYKDHQGPGLYRIKYADSDNLLYVGFSGNLQGSVRSMSRDALLQTSKNFYHITSYITDSLRADVKVSICTPKKAEFTEQLIGMGYAAVAVHRREEEFTPPLNLRDRNLIRPDPDTPTIDELKEKSAEPLSWESWEDVRSREWMVGGDTEWAASQNEPSHAKKLFHMWNRNPRNTTAQRIYRMWDEEYETWKDEDISSDTYLSYIGHNISFDNAMLAEESNFSFIDIGEVVSEVTPIKYRDIFVELLGAHYLATGTLPVKQHSSVSPYRETRHLPNKLLE
jgi:hypothetical protein